MGITITLSKIKAHDPCEDGWDTIIAATHLHGGDYEKPFLLSAALDTNGVDDTLWALKCLPEHDRLWRKYAVWCARRVQHLMTDQRSLDALDVADRHADGLATDAELAAARAAGGASRDAAQAAAWASRAAARAAAWASRDAAQAAAWASRDAAQAAAWASRDASRAASRAAALATAQAAQSQKLRQILDAGKWVD